MVDFKDPKVIAGIVVGCVVLFLVVIISALYATGNLTSPSIGTIAPITFGPTSAPISTGVSGSPTFAPTGSPTSGPTSAPTSGLPSFPPVAVGAEAVFSPDTSGNHWIEVFDSMKGNSKCIFDASNYNTTEVLSPVNYAKLEKYIIENGLRPMDDPFQDVTDYTITNCSGVNVPITLTLDLSRYNGVNPFKPGDPIYIYGVKGNTAANSPGITDIASLGMGLYIFSTKTINSKLLPNQVVISNGYPCNFDGTNCTSPDSLNPPVKPVFGTGNYTGGGIIRKYSLANYASGSLDNFSFYTTTLNPPVQFIWPMQPITISDARAFYQNHYSNYLQWLVKILPINCITIPIVFGPGSSFNGSGEQDLTKYVSGPATASGGSGSGLKLDITKISLYGHDIMLTIVTNEGSGYQNGDTINIIQGSASNVAITLDTVTNCSKQNYSSN